jgi:hypothetical protein
MPPADPPPPAPVQIQLPAWLRAITSRASLSTVVMTILLLRVGWVDVLGSPRVHLGKLLEVIEWRKPTPEPDKPAPGPPIPDPSGNIDPKIRAAAEAYFRVAHQAYSDVKPTIAATEATYNDLESAIKDAVKNAGTTLGQSVDGVTADLHDPQLKLKDKAAAQAAYQKVDDSIFAGLIDAARKR